MFVRIAFWEMKIASEGVGARSWVRAWRDSEDAQNALQLLDQEFWLHTEKPASFI